jgi:hypothetical protein
VTGTHEPYWNNNSQETEQQQKYRMNDTNSWMRLTYTCENWSIDEAINLKLKQME